MGAAIPKKCMDKRPCFARERGSRRCLALVEVYNEGRMCPFCKQKRNVYDDGWKDRSY